MENAERNERSDDEEERQSSCIRSTSLITLEPGLFLAIFAYSVQSVIVANLLIDKTCLVNFNLTSDVCGNLSQHDEQTKIQKYVANLSMYQNILGAIPGIILALFVGPWSDTHGRKPLIMAPAIGNFICQIVYAFNVYFASLPAEWLLLSVIYSLFGGIVVMFTGVFAYITDITTEESRTSRVACAEFFNFVGYPVGLFASGPLFLYGGYYAVFGTSALASALAFLYFLFRVKETRRNTSDASRHIFKLDHVTSVFRTCFRKRENNKRTIVLTLLAMMILSVSTFFNGNISYLYTRLKFSWTEQDYTVYTAVSSSVANVCSFSFLAIFNGKLKFRDANLGIVGALSGVAGYIVWAMATKGWMLYLVPVVGSLSSAGAVLIRSMLSKVGDASEVGKIFSLLASLEACIPLFMTPLMTQIYNATITFFPGTLFLVFSGIFGVMALGFVLVRCLVVQAEYAVLVNEENQNGEEDRA